MYQTRPVTPRHFIEARLIAIFCGVIAIACLLGIGSSAAWPHIADAGSAGGTIRNDVIVSAVVTTMSAICLALMSKGTIAYRRYLVVIGFLASISTTMVALGSYIISEPTQASWTFGYISLLLVGVSVVQVTRRLWIIAVLYIWISWLTAAFLSDFGNSWRAALPMVIVATLMSAHIMSGMRHQRRVYVTEIDRTSATTNIDPLTRVLNRRGALHVLQRRLSELSHPHVVTYFIDMNKLKHINDTYGHADGDQAIATVADALRYTTRADSDIVCRWGGDEFVVFSIGAPDGTPDSAYDAETRINEWITEHSDPRLPWTPSVSVGVADTTETVGVPDMLVAAADEAMYERRNRNRNS